MRIANHSPEISAFPLRLWHFSLRTRLKALDRNVESATTQSGVHVSLEANVVQNVKSSAKRPIILLTLQEYLSASPRLADHRHSVDETFIVPHHNIIWLQLNDKNVELLTFTPFFETPASSIRFSTSP